MLKRILFLFALALMASPLLFAQITSSSITGTVKNGSNEPLVGATIVATHVPSGTKYTTISRSGGDFSIQNMRVGGPYTIEISFVGFQTDKYDDVYLKLAESFLLNSSLSKTNTTLENVVVATTGRRNQILSSTRTGAVTNINRRDIAQLPSISRSLNDFTKATPQSSGVSIGGGNYRQNNFTIDGSDFNNNFGITTGAGNLPAGGSPISIDAVEEISVNITPFDVRQSGFIGSAINAITRSGTNTFSGSVYEYYHNQNQRGHLVEKASFIVPPEQFKQYGARFGGPIIKNKVFFFLNYESEKIPSPVQTRFAASASAAYGSSPQIARPTRDSLDYMRQYLMTKYEYDPGIYDNYTTEKSTKKILGRLDWNINSKNHFNIRYSQVEGGSPSPPSTSFSGTGASAPAGGGRQDVTALWFKNSNYFQGLNFYSFAAELNSTIGRVANTFRGTYTYQNESRSSDSQVFPFVDILSSGQTSAPAVYTSFGYEPFTYGNLRKVKTYAFVDNLKWTTKKHSWVAGAQVDFSNTINGFQRFATSYYEFSTWSDFVNAQKPIAFAYTYSLSPGFAQAFPSFKAANYAAYMQDEITVTKDFRLTIGLRADDATYPSVPEIKTHPLIQSLTFADGQVVNTGKLPKAKITWSPRVGFNWDLYGDRSFQIRGGTGVFVGKVPFVWIVSQSGDAGLLQVTQSFNSPGTIPGPFNPDPRAYYPSTIPAAGTVIPSTIEIVDPNYKNPASWKSSLAFDTKLPAGLVLTVEAIYNKDYNTTYFKNINLSAPSPLAVAGYPDSRMIYPNPTNLKFINPLTAAGLAVPNGSALGTSAFNVVSITNSNKGYYFSLTAKVEKQFSKGFSASIAYTKSMASNLYDGAGDQPLSAWQSELNVNGPNTPALGYANYVMPDRVIATLSYRKEYIKHLASTFSLIYQGSADGRFSYVYGADFNRDGFSGNDLMYIPKNPSEITFVATTINGVNYSAQQQSDLFFAYVAQDKYLSKHMGQYAERNGGQYPWRNQVDVKFLQDLFTNVGKNRNTFQFSIDIFNLGNLLNKSWGKVKTLNATSGQLLIPQNVASLVPGGAVVPTFKLASDRGNPITRTFRDLVSTASTYFMQFGVRYMFN